MIIDIHTHAFPDELAPRAMQLLYEGCEVPPQTDGTCAGLIASMQAAGIDRSAIMPIATRPGQVRSINKWAAGVNKQYPELICFGTLHPQQDDMQAEIDRLVADGVPGVKFHPDYQEFFVDDPQWTPMYRGLADAGLIALFHAGVDIGLPPPVHCAPDRLARVLDAVPDLTVIAAHMGGYKCWEDVERYLAGRDLYFDSSYSLADMGPEAMAALMRAHGIERILFATDSPWTNQSDEVAGIRALDLTDDEIAAVLGGNASVLLNP
jgi:predicted TIM-barrel fold metal-dependent hydrolase